MPQKPKITRRATLAISAVGTSGLLAGCLGVGDDTDDGRQDDEDDADDSSNETDSNGTDNGTDDDDTAENDTQLIADGVGELGGGAGDTWQMFRGDRYNTGYVVDGTAITDPEVLWEFETDDAVWGSPVVANSRVFVPSYDERIYALDLADGSPLWTFEMDGISDATPAVSDGVVVCGSFDEHIYGIDAESGDELWRYDAGAIVRSSPTIVDETVYIGAHCQLFECAEFAEDEEEGKLFALDLETGETQWIFETTAGVVPKPAVSENAVFVATSGEGVVALRRETGERHWVYETDDSVYTSPSIVDGVVYVGDLDGTVHAIDAVTSEEEWTYDSESRFFTSSPAVDAENIYIGAAFDEVDGEGPIGGILVVGRTGEKQWIQTVDTFEVGSSPVVVDDHVYLGAHFAVPTDEETAGFYGFTTDGEKAWKFPLPGQGSGSSPAFIGGMLVFGSVDGTVYALSQPE